MFQHRKIPEPDYPKPENEIFQERNYIDINWNLMQVSDPTITTAHVKCIKNKWNIFGATERQGWDSDCAVHCSEFENCCMAFNNAEFHLKNHMKSVYVSVDDLEGE